MSLPYTCFVVDDRDDILSTLKVANDSVFVLNHKW